LNAEEIQNLKRELVARNNSGLSKIYSQYKLDCIRILVSKKICNEEKGQDVYTEAVLVLRKNIISGKVVELSNTLSYLVSVCRNLLLQDQRKEYRRMKKEEQIMLNLYDEKWEDTERLEYKKELAAKCKDALMQLSERCQQILISFYVHGLKMREIAEELGLSSADVAKTTKSRCYKSWIRKVKELGI